MRWISKYTVLPVALLLFLLLLFLFAGCSIGTNPFWTIEYTAEHAASGSVPEHELYRNGESAAVKGNTGNLTRTNYHFAGWIGPEEVLYEAGDIVTNKTEDGWRRSITFTAYWEADSPKSIIYNPNGADGGSVPADSESYSMNDDIPVSGNTGELTKSGYLFSGWKTSPELEEAEFEAGITYKFSDFPKTDSVQLYAHWETAYSVSFTAGTADEGTTPDTQLAAYEGTVILPENTGKLKKDSRIFSGWTDDAVSGSHYYPGEAYCMPQHSVSFSPVWSQAEAVKASHYTSALLLTDGSLWISGESIYENRNYTRFSYIDEQVTDFYIGYKALFYKKSDGIWRVLGYNTGSRFGFSTEERYITYPAEIPDKNFIDISAENDFYTLFAEDDGALYMSGYDSNHLFGGSRDHFYFVANKVRNVSSSSYHHLIVKTDNSLWGLGDNYAYRLGLPEHKDYYNLTKVMDNVKQAEAAGNDSLILKTDGTLLGFGSNYGSSSTPKEITQNVKCIETTYGTRVLIQKKDHTLWYIFPDNETAGEPEQIAEDAVSIAHGSSHLFYIDSFGRLWGRGNNSYGQLGIHSTESRDEFVRVF